MAESGRQEWEANEKLAGMIEIQVDCELQDDTRRPFSQEYIFRNIRDGDGREETG